MYKLSSILLMAMILMQVSCIEETGQVSIEEQESAVRLDAAAPVVVDNLVGDWQLNYGSTSQQFRVLPGTPRIIAVGAQSASSSRVHIYQGKMTLTIGNDDSTLLVTADVANNSGTYAVSNVVVVKTDFFGAQSTFSGSITSDVIASFYFGISDFANTFTVNYAPRSGGATILGVPTLVVSKLGEVTYNGASYPDATVNALGDFKWDLSFPYAGVRIDMQCEASIYYIYIPCDYLLIDPSSGFEYEGGTAQLTPSGYTAVSLAGNFKVYIPGVTTPATVSVYSDGTAYVQGYGSYYMGAVVSANTFGHTKVEFTNGDDHLMIRWFARPYYAPYQGSGRVIETLRGQEGPLMGVIVERI
jgi:hypothetical protein